MLKEIKNKIIRIQELRRSNAATKIQNNQIRQDVIDQKRYPWHAETLVDQLYKDLYDTPEREKFSQLSKKANEDAEFEKYFRSAHLEIFFGIVVTPQNL